MFKHWYKLMFCITISATLCVSIAEGFGSLETTTSTYDVADTVTQETSTQYATDGVSPGNYTIHTENYDQNDTFSNSTPSTEKYHNNIHKNIEEIIRMALQDSLSSSLDAAAAAEYDVDGDIRDTADVLILQLSMNIRQITDKVNSTIKEKKMVESIKTLNNTLVQLKNTTHSEPCNLQNTLNSTEDNATISSATVSREEWRVMNTMCNITVPSSVVADHGIWKKYERPAEDDLDRFMVNRTGCSSHTRDRFSLYTLPDEAYNGELLVWRGAVRAKDDASITVAWAHKAGYSFDIGSEGNTITKVTNFYSYEERSQPTPGVLAPDRYVPFYIKIQDGKLTLGKECDGEPIITEQVDIERGDEVSIIYGSNSYYAGRFLYCPVNVAVVNAELAALLRNYGKTGELDSSAMKPQARSTPTTLDMRFLIRH